MSTIVAEALRISKIEPHPGADKLEFAVVQGWRCAVPKGRFAQGELVLYIPIDACLPVAIAEKIGITKYLGRSNRVKAAKLRGESSFGIVVKNGTFDFKFVEGKDYTSKLGIEKFIPGNFTPPDPSRWNKIRRFVSTKVFWLLRKLKIVRSNRGEKRVRNRRNMPQHPLFPKYTEIEHLRKYHKAMEGRDVIVTEKLHGRNWRGGWFEEDGKTRMVYGSHYSFCPGEDTIYYEPMRMPVVTDIINVATDLFPGVKQVIVYGELIGPHSQGKMPYAVERGSHDFRAFDILIDGKFVDTDVFEAIVPPEARVPVLYRGPFDFEKIVALADGKTLVNGAKHIREGIVVKPLKEEWGFYGRLILKCHGINYLTGNFENEEIDEES